MLLPIDPQTASYQQQQPLSCEAAALHTALAVLGLHISEADILAAEPSSEDPDQGFRGNVDANQDYQDYGIHARGLLKTLDALKTSGALPGDVQGRLLRSLDDAKAALAQRQPVVCWIPLQLMPAQRVTATLSSGKQVHLVEHEHTITLRGYNDSQFQALDPFDGTQPSYDAAALAQGNALFDDPLLAVGRGG